MKITLYILAGILFSLPIILGLYISALACAYALSGRCGPNLKVLFSNELAPITFIMWAGAALSFYLARRRGKKAKSNSA